MDIDEIKIEVEEKVLSVLKEKSLELFELIAKNRNGTIGFEALIDKTNGGIAISECAIVNRQMVEWLDGDGAFEYPYTFEVSSPGIDAPLRNEKDFVRVMGIEIDVYLNDKQADRLQYSGILDSVNKEEIVLRVGSDIVSIPLKNIAKAVQKI